MTHAIEVLLPGNQSVRTSFLEWTDSEGGTHNGASPRTAILLHGALAQAHWWDAIAPKIMPLGFDRVIALDLAGHGDSDALPKYSRSVWASRLVAFLDAVDAGENTVVIGHSLGGAVALEAVHQSPNRWRHTILIDSATHWRPTGGPRSPFAQQPEPVTEEAREQQRYFPRLEDMVARFRLIPPQPMPPQEVLTRIVRTGIRHVPSLGWTWKFDPRVLTKLPDEPLAEIDPGLRGKLSYIRGELSALVPPARFAEIIEQLGDEHAVSIPGTFHHVILEQPVEVVDAIRSLLSARTSSQEVDSMFIPISPRSNRGAS